MCVNMQKIQCTEWSHVYDDCACCQGYLLGILYMSIMVEQIHSDNNFIYNNHYDS